MEPDQPLLPEAVRAALDEVSPGEQAALAAVWARLEAGVAPPLDPARVQRIRTTLARAAGAVDRPARRPARLARIRPGWAGAAVGGLVVLLAGLWLLRPVVVTAPPGAVRALLLPDGSRVELNHAARLTYRPFFGRLHRRLTLDGAAFFDVVEATVPFEVTTFNARVAVLGTRFEVDAAREGRPPHTTVRLEAGRLRLAARRDEQRSVILGEGQAASITDAVGTPAAPVALPDGYRAAWRKTTFRFENQPLAEIFAAIERRYAVEIEAAQPEILTRRLTYFDQQSFSAEDLIYDLCQIEGLQYRHRAPRRYLIFAPDGAPR